MAPCTTTPAGAFQIIGDGDGDNFDWITESDDELNAEGSVFASYINPYLTKMDPIMIGSVTFTASGSAIATPTSTALPKYGTSSAWALFFHQANANNYYQGLDYNIDEYTVEHCATDATWKRSVGVQADPQPTSLTDITVFGDTCSLTLSWPRLPVSWQSVPAYEKTVGKLKCEKYGDATCRNGDLNGTHCETQSDFQFWVVSCVW